jgi:hypothetical protein
MEENSTRSNDVHESISRQDVEATMGKLEDKNCPGADRIPTELIKLEEITGFRHCITSSANQNLETTGQRNELSQF